MKTIATIGLDPAKNVFQAHGIDDAGNILVGGNFGELRCYGFSTASSLALSASKRAAVHITGRGKSKNSAILSS